MTALQVNIITSVLIMLLIPFAIWLTVKYNSFQRRGIVRRTARISFTAISHALRGDLDEEDRKELLKLKKLFILFLAVCFIFLAVPVSYMLVMFGK